MQAYLLHRWHGLCSICAALPLEQAVAAGDRALAYGMVSAVLDDKLAQMARWPGPGRLDGLSRYWILVVKALVSR
jgi:hypothetical protein